MDSLPFTVVDMGIIAILVLSGIFAFLRGFVREVLSVVAWVGAVLAVIFGLPYVKPIARDLIGHELAADVAAGAAIFLTTLIALSLLTFAISKNVKSSALNALDRSLGFVFGVARGGVLVCLAYILVEWLVAPPNQPAWLLTARAMPLVEWGATRLKALVPEDRWEANAEKADQARDEARKLLETERLLRDMMNPEPKGSAVGAESEREGYSPDERRQMDRLIESGR